MCHARKILLLSLAVAWLTSAESAFGQSVTVDSLSADSLCCDTLPTTYEGYMLDEVVVRPYLPPVSMQPIRFSPTDAQLLQQPGEGFNPLGLILWGISKIVGPRHKMTREEKFRKVMDNY